MGVEDKTALRVGGRTLLDRAIEAVADAARIVVVGPTVTTERPVTWTRERPAGSGPIAGIAAGLAALRLGANACQPVVILSGDTPFAGTAVPRLRAALASHDAAVLCDSGGRDQFLVAAWNPAALRARLGSSADLAGMPVRRLYTNADVARTPAADNESLDCDNPDDLRRAARIAADQSQ